MTTAVGTNCFGGAKLPKLLRHVTANSQDVTNIAVTGNADAIYYGGKAKDDGGMSPFGSEGSQIVRVDLASLSTVWAMLYRDAATDLETISALALNPTANKLAVYAYNQNSHHTRGDDEETWLFIVDANSGLMVSKTFFIDPQVAVLLTSNSMRWDAYDKLYLASAWSGKGHRDNDREKAGGTGSRYEQRQRIARFDVSTSFSESLDFYYAQNDWFGRSNTLILKDAGSSSNLYIGGASDPIHLTHSSPIRWAPSITLLDSDGQTQMMWMLRVSGSYETSNNVFTMIDNMELDETGATPYMFGTTRASAQEHFADRIYIWRVSLHPTAGTIDTNSLYSKHLQISSEQNDFKVTGIKPTLDGLSQDEMHIVFHSRDSKGLVYAKCSLTDASLTFETRLLSNRLEDIGESFFVGSTGESIGSFSPVYASYSSGYTVNIQSTLGTTVSRSKDIGVIFPTLPSQSCIGVVGSGLNNKSIGALSQTTIVSHTPSGSQGTFTTYGASVYAENNSRLIRHRNFDPSKIYSDDWCQSVTTVTNAAPPTTFAWDTSLPVSWDDCLHEQSFDPPQFISPACTDSGNVFNYWLSTPSGVNEEHYHIAIDGINNKIQVIAKSSGSGTLSISHTAHYSTPDGFSGSFAFVVHVTPGGTDCSSVAITPPAHDATKTYRIGDPTGQYDVSTWTASPSACPIGYSVVAVPAAPFLTETALKRGMSWYTADDSLAGTSYTITVTARAGCGGVVTDTVQYVLNVLPGCDETHVMTFAPSTGAIPYTILAPGTSSVATSITSPALTSSDTGCTLTRAFEVRDPATGIWEDYDLMPAAARPSWITNYDNVAWSFDIDSTDASLAGEVVALRFGATDDAAAPASAYDTFTVTFSYECQADVLTMTSADGRTAVDHVLGQVDALASQLQSHTHPNCPVVTTMEVMDASSGQWILYSSVSDINILVSSMSATDGSFSLDSSSLTQGQIDGYMPRSSYAVRQTYTSPDSLAPGGTVEDYFSLTVRADCGDAVLSQTAVLADQTCVDSSTCAPFAPQYSYSRDSAQCPITAVLYIFDSANNVWEQYDALNANHAFVSSVQPQNTLNLLDAGTTQFALDSTTIVPYKPQTSVPMKIEVSNPDASVPLTLTYEFEAVLVDACRDSALAWSSRVDDLAYTIDNRNAAATAAQTVLFDTVHSSPAGLTRCPVSIALQIYHNGVWTDYATNAATFPWVTNYVTDTSFEVQTDDYATYADPSSPYTASCRIVATDPDSLTTTATIAEPFAISFDSECADHQVSIATPLSATVAPTELVTSGTPGSFRTAATPVITHSPADHSDCPHTVIFEVWDPPSNAWYDVVATGLFSSSLAWSVDHWVVTYDPAAAWPDITAGTTGKHDVTWRWTYVSISSAQAASTIVEEVTVAYHNACFGSVLSLNAAQADDVFLLPVSGTPVTQYGPTFTLSTVGDGCTLSTTEYVLDTANNVWQTWDNSFDFWNDCTTLGNPCDALVEGTVKITKPLSIAAYKPFTDFTFKVVAADSGGYATPAESQFTIQLRDECADATLTVATDAASKEYYMDLTGFPSFDDKIQSAFVSSVATGCAVTLSPEYYDDAALSWLSVTTALDFVSGVSSAITDTYVTVNMSGAPANSYRPTKVVNFRWTVVSTDSVAAGGTAEDTFTVTFIDVCKDSQLAWATGASTSDKSFFVGLGSPSSNFQAATSLTQNNALPDGSCADHLTAAFEMQDATTGDWTDVSGETWVSSFSASGATASELQVQYTSAQFNIDYPTSEIATFTVRVTLSNPRSTDAANELVDQFTITFRDSCWDDSVVPGTANMGEIEILIESGPTTLPGVDFAQMTTGCPLSFTLEFYDTHAAAWLSYSTEGFVSSWDAANGDLVIAVGALDYAAYSTEPARTQQGRITVTTTSSSLASDTSVTDTFTLKFVDQCRLLTSLQTPALQFTSPLPMALNQPGSGVYTLAQFLQAATPNCQLVTDVTEDDTARTAYPGASIHVAIPGISPSGTINFSAIPTATTLRLVLRQRMVISTGAQETIYTSELPFEITVTDPCAETSGVIRANPLTPIEYWVGDAAHTVQLGAGFWYDEVSETTFSTPNYCGPKLYELIESDQQTVSTASYLSLTNINANENGPFLTLTVDTADPQHTTNAAATYYIKVTLVNHAISEVYYEPFTINIRKCIVSTFNSNADEALTYNIYTPVEYIAYAAFTEAPDLATVRAPATSCGYAIQYTAQWRTYYDTVIALPSFITWNQGQLRFEIQSDSASDITSVYQTYTIELVGSTSSSDASPIVSKTQSFVFTVNDGCQNDVLALVSSNFDPTYTYYINENTDSSFTPSLAPIPQQKVYGASWSNSVQGCPVDFALKKLDSATGAYIDLTAAELQTFSLQNAMSIQTSTPFASQSFATTQVELKAETSDFTLDGVVMNLKVYRVSPRSGVTQSTSIELDIAITLRNVCWDLPITQAPTGDGVANTMYLFAPYSLALTPVDTQWGDYCDGYSYEMTYISGPLLGSPKAEFSAHSAITDVSVPQIAGSYQDTDWLGVHVVGITGCLGDRDGVRTGAYYGTNCASSQWTMTMLSPCDFSSFTDTYNGVMGVTYTLGDGVKSIQYEVPTDAASTAYGNGYDKCGARVHYLQSSTVATKLYPANGDASTTTFQPLAEYPYLEFLYFPSGDPTGSSTVPVYQINVKTDSELHYGTHVFEQHFELADYPSSLANDVNQPLKQFTVVIEPCRVHSFTAPGNLTAVYEIGRAKQTITYTASQYPCNYGATYSATVTRNGTDIDELKTPLSSKTPDFLVQASREGQMTIYSTDREDKGFFEVQVTLVLDNLNLEAYGNNLYTPQSPIDIGNPPASLIYTTSFFLTIEMFDPVAEIVVGNNTAPFFLPAPTDLYAYIGEAFEHSFGDVQDYEIPDGQTVRLEYDLGAASAFAIWATGTNAITISEGATTASSAEVSDIRISLTDDYSSDFFDDVPGVTSYSIRLFLIERDASAVLDADDPHYIKAKDEYTQEVVDDLESLHKLYDKRVYDLRNTTLDDVLNNKNEDVSFLRISLQDALYDYDADEQAEYLAKQEFRGKLPTPTIESLDNDGLLTIKFDKKLRVPDAYKKIETEEVALRFTSARNETYLTMQGYKDFQIRPALELQIQPSETQEAENLDFTWEIVEFTDTQVVIQLYFDLPEQISSDPNNADHVTVTFWANDFFVSEEGYEVKQGQTLKTEIVRQIPLVESRYLKLVSAIVGWVIAGVIFGGLAIAIYVDADTLPFWAFYDTLQLLTHLPLANVSMPGQTAIFLSTIASMLRLQTLGVDELISSLLGVDFEIHTTTELQRQAGYRSSYILVNLAAILALLALALAVYVLTKAIDTVAGYSPRQVLPPNGRTQVHHVAAPNRVMNACTRLLMMGLLEMLICSLMNIAADTSLSNSEFQRYSKAASYAVMGVLMLLLAACTCLVIRFRCTRQLTAVQRKIPHGCETIFLGMYPELVGDSLYYVLAWFWRRVVYAAAMILLTRLPVAQVFILITSSTVMGGLLGSLKPYETRGNQYLQMFNEGIVFVASFFLLTFTQNINEQVVSTTVHDRKLIGYLLSALVLVAIVVNIVVLAHSVVWQVGFRIRRKENLAFKAAATGQELELDSPSLADKRGKRLNRQNIAMNGRTVRQLHTRNLEKLNEIESFGEMEPGDGEGRNNKVGRFRNFWYGRNKVKDDHQDQLQNSDGKHMLASSLDRTNALDVTADHFVNDASVDESNRKHTNLDKSSRLYTRNDAASKRSDFALNNMATDGDDDVLDIQPNLNQVFKYADIEQPRRGLDQSVFVKYNQQRTDQGREAPTPDISAYDASSDYSLPPMGTTIHRDKAASSQHSPFGRAEDRSRTAYSNELVTQERWADSLMQDAYDAPPVQDKDKRANPKLEDGFADYLTGLPVFEKQANGRVARVMSKAERNERNKARPDGGDH